ncbi:hypothetical protein [Pseudomonas sp.]|uniref:hypothetical protein n=1 Tax=Pseudomonas sp. TaxID=306 RepID=UPI003C73D046
MLYIGSFLAFFIGVAHSFLGEKYILIRLFRREDLPKLLGSDWFTKRVLRFAWHLTTIAWWGFASIMYLLSNPSEKLKQEILLVTAAVFLLSGLFSAGFTKGKHFSWAVFWAISAVCFYSATNS